MKYIKGKIKRGHLATLAMVAGNEKRIKRVIVDGEVREWVGFGWTHCGKPTAEDRRKLQEVA